jgi:hypothetical protein
MDSYDILHIHTNKILNYKDKFKKNVKNKDILYESKNNLTDILNKQLAFKKNVCNYDFESFVNISIYIIQLKDEIKYIKNKLYNYENNINVELNEYMKKTHKYLSLYMLGTDKEREYAINQYMLLVDPVLYVSIKRKRIICCELCNSKYINFVEHGEYVCKKCSHITKRLLDEISYDNSNDTNFLSKASNYSRKTFFMSHVRAFMGLPKKNKKQISIKLVNRIKQEMLDNNINNLKSNISSELVIKYLKQMGLSNYVGDTAFIISKIKGEKLPIINADDLNKIIEMFTEFELIWPHIKNINQKSINYQYILKKILELLENYDKYLNRIKISNNNNNIKKLDIIWKRACKLLKWQFINTYI